MAKLAARATPAVVMRPQEQDQQDQRHHDDRERDPSQVGDHGVD